MINNKYELKRQIHYNQYTGQFTRIIKQHMGKNALGAVTGPTAIEKGAMKINYKWYQLSRLAYMYMTGEWPKGYVFHIDGDATNFKWSNLRSSTGLGYSSTWVEGKNRFQVYFKHQYLGIFKTTDEADEAIKKHYEHFLLTEKESDLVNIETNTEDN
jgi:hypothetical protein